MIWLRRARRRRARRVAEWVAVILLGLFTLFAWFCIGAPVNYAFAHGTLSWAAEYTSANGIPCCTGPSEHGQGDCAEVSEAVAMLVRLGGSVPVQFPSGERMVRINRIYASPDPNAPFVVCSPGCAFSGAGV